MTVGREVEERTLRRVRSNAELQENWILWRGCKHKVGRLWGLKIRWLSLNPRRHKPQQLPELVPQLKEQTYVCGFL